MPFLTLHWLPTFYESNTIKLQQQKGKNADCICAQSLNQMRHNCNEAHKLTSGQVEKRTDSLTSSPILNRRAPSTDMSKEEAHAGVAQRCCCYCCGNCGGGRSGENVMLTMMVMVVGIAWTTGKSIKWTLLHWCSTATQRRGKDHWQLVWRHAPVGQEGKACKTKKRKKRLRTKHTINDKTNKGMTKVNSSSRVVTATGGCKWNQICQRN